jgi:hypothetical protein
MSQQRPRQVNLVVPPRLVRMSDYLGLRSLSDAVLACFGGIPRRTQAELVSALRNRHAEVNARRSVVGSGPLGRRMEKQRTAVTKLVPNRRIGEDA